VVIKRLVPPSGGTSCADSSTAASSSSSSNASSISQSVQEHRDEEAVLGVRVEDFVFQILEIGLLQGHRLLLLLERVDHFPVCTATAVFGF
jgi:hypothetical protein